MTKRAVFLFLLGVLCVSPALAATKRQVVTKLQGTRVFANFFSDFPGAGFAELILHPAQLPDGSMGYTALIFWNDFHNEISGFVLDSAISTRGLLHPVQVNITLDSFYATGVDPTGDFSGFTSLVGTFTPYKGLYGFISRTSGTQQYTNINTDGSTETNTTTGNSQYETASFEGTLNATGGPYSLEVPGPNAVMSVTVGTETDVLTAP